MVELQQQHVLPLAENGPALETHLHHLVWRETEHLVEVFGVFEVRLPNVQEGREALLYGRHVATHLLDAGVVNALDAASRGGQCGGDQVAQTLEDVPEAVLLLLLLFGM